jgi:hypothetical protein
MEMMETILGWIAMVIGAVVAWQTLPFWMNLFFTGLPSGHYPRILLFVLMVGPPVLTWAAAAAAVYGVGWLVLRGFQK